MSHVVVELVPGRDVESQSPLEETKAVRRRRFEAKVGQPGRVNQKDSGRAMVAAMVSPEPQFNVPEDIPATEMVWV